MDDIKEIKITLVEGDPSGFINSLSDSVMQKGFAQEVTPVRDTYDKGPIPLDPNTLLVTLAASGGVLTTLIGLIQTKLSKDKTVSIEIEGSKLVLTGVSDENQEELIRLWVKQVSKKQNRKVRK